MKVNDGVGAKRANRSQCPQPGKQFVPASIDHKEVVDVSVNIDEVELKRLLGDGEFAAAFFLSRRLLTRGELWAEPYLEQAQNGLDSDDDVHIP